MTRNTLIFGLIFTFAFPISAPAQTFSVEQEAQIEAITQRITELQIQILLARIAELQAQIQELLTKQAEQSVQLGAIQQNVVAPAPSPVPIPTPTPSPTPSWKIFEQDNPFGPGTRGSGWDAMVSTYNLYGTSTLQTQGCDEWQDVGMTEGCLAAKAAIEAIQ